MKRIRILARKFCSITSCSMSFASLILLSRLFLLCSCTNTDTFTFDEDTYANDTNMNTNTGMRKARYLDLDRIPQHRVLVSKRVVPYRDHPWETHLNGFPSDADEDKDAEFKQNANDQRGRKNNREIHNHNHDSRHSRRLENDEIEEEFLPKSQMNMWSIMSSSMDMDELKLAPTPSAPPTTTAISSNGDLPSDEEQSDNDTDGTDSNISEDDGSVIFGDNDNNEENPKISRYKNIRIKATLLDEKSSGAAYLNEPERKLLLVSMIRPAIQSWSKALSVIPVRDRLVIDREQLYDQKSCGPGLDSGLPSVVVPEDHMHMEVGINNTDLMIYLSVGFHEDILKEISDKNGNDENSKVLQPTKNIGDGWEDVPEPSEEPGVDNLNANGPICSGAYLASSTYCSTDQFDRPVGGMLHLCIGKDFFKKENIETNRVTIMHEIGHILGFNSQSLAHFREKDNGKPLTEREKIYGDVKDVKVECAGVAKGRGEAFIPLPSEKVLKFRNVRGGQRVAQIVTPNVRQVARNHFNCQDLEGAELETYSYPINENEPQSDFVDRCLSDHWEHRLFKSDIMNPIVDTVNSISHISPLTLAYFLDSGWYEVDVSRAAEPDVWGRGAGCDFVQEQCISNGQVKHKNSQFFCSSTRKGCADDMMGKASCNLVAYENELAVEFQHFADPHVGGEDIYLDYCPSFVGKKRDSCRNKNSKVFRMEEIGETSRCLSGKHGSDKNAPLCVPVACVIDKSALYVRVDGIWEECAYEGQVIVTWTADKDYVVCPDPVRTCPSFFCPRNCLFNEFASACNENKCSCEGISHDDCDYLNSFHIEANEDQTPSPLYVLESVLENDNKDLFDHTVRMFTQMSAGEVIGFVASSLVAIGTCFILGTYVYRCMKQPTFRLPRLWDQAWRTDVRRIISAGSTEEISGQRNKDKMVANVLNHMRIESSVPNPTEEIEGVLPIQEGKVFYRSELPPLPGVGRVISVVGSTYINDSIVPFDADDVITLDGTANESRTSGAYDLNSGRGIAPNVYSNERFSPVPSRTRKRNIRLPRRYNE